MCFTGHTSGVYSFSFSADSGKVATVSKDGTWKVFNTAIEYLKGQDANVIMSGDYSKELDSSKQSQVTISPDGKMVALSQDRQVNLYSVLTGKLLASIEEPHTQSITKVWHYCKDAMLCQLFTLLFQVLFSADCQYLFTAGDKHIRIFHNVPGIQNTLLELKETLKRNLSNSAAKERIEIQIKAAEENLKQINSNYNK